MCLRNKLATFSNIGQLRSYHASHVQQHILGPDFQSIKTNHPEWSDFAQQNQEEGNHSKPNTRRVLYCNWMQIEDLIYGLGLGNINNAFLVGN